MRLFATSRYRALAVVLLIPVTGLVGCGEPASRDLNDATPPNITISVAGTRANPGGIDEIGFGTTTDLSASGAQVLVKATDDDGVANVELWLTEKRQCQGVTTGPGLAGAPAARVVGNVTPTQAPADLTAIFRIDSTSRRSGCLYTFEVWGEADNAANTTVHTKSPTVALTLRT